MLTIEFVLNAKVAYFEKVGKKPLFMRIGYEAKRLLLESIIAELPQQKYVPFQFCWNMYMTTRELPDDMIVLSRSSGFEDGMSFKQETPPLRSSP